MAQAFRIETLDRSGRWYLTAGTKSIYDLRIRNDSKNPVDCSLVLEDPPSGVTVDPKSFALRGHEVRTVTVTFAADAPASRSQRIVMSLRDDAGNVLATFEHPLVVAGGTDCNVALAWKDVIVEAGEVRGFELICNLRSQSEGPSAFPLSYGAHPALKFPELPPVQLEPGQAADIVIPVRWDRNVKDENNYNHPTMIEIGVAVSNGRRTGRMRWETIESRLQPFAWNSVLAEAQKPAASPSEQPSAASATAAIVAAAPNGPPVAPAAAMAAAQAVPADVAAPQTAPASAQIVDAPKPPVVEPPKPAEAQQPSTPAAASTNQAAPPPPLNGHAEMKQLTAPKSTSSSATAAPVAPSALAPADGDELTLFGFMNAGSAVQPPPAQPATPTQPELPLRTATVAESSGDKAAAAALQPAAAAPTPVPESQAAVAQAAPSPAVPAAVQQAAVASTAAPANPPAAPVAPPTAASAPSATSSPPAAPAPATVSALPSAAASSTACSPPAAASAPLPATSVPARPAPALTPYTPPSQSAAQQTGSAPESAATASAPTSAQQEIVSAPPITQTPVPARMVRAHRSTDKESRPRPIPPGILIGALALIALAVAGVLFKPAMQNQVPSTNPVVVQTPIVAANSIAPPAQSLQSTVVHRAAAHKAPAVSKPVSSTPAPRPTVATPQPAETPKPQTPQPTPAPTAPPVTHRSPVVAAQPPHPSRRNRLYSPASGPVVALGGISAFYGPRGRAVRVIWSAAEQSSASVQLIDDRGTTVNSTYVRGGRQSVILYLPAHFRGALTVSVSSTGRLGERVAETTSLPPFGG